MKEEALFQVAIANAPRRGHQLPAIHVELMDNYDSDFALPTFYNSPNLTTPRSIFMSSFVPLI
jgi:hypothetical protein